MKACVSLARVWSVSYTHLDVYKRQQEIVCGATNFDVGDLVVVVLPGATLPGGFQISARKTYGRVSNGMICAEDEIGLGDDHSGIIVLSRLLGESAAAALRPGDDAIALLGLDDQVVELNITCLLYTSRCV